MNAAAEWFRRNRGRRKSIAGIMLTSFLVYEKGAGSDRAHFIPRTASVTAALHVDLTLNPSYAGSDVLVGLLLPKNRFEPGYRRWDPDKTEFVESTPFGVRVKPVK